MIRDAFKSLKGLVLCSLICISYLNVFAQDNCVAQEIDFSSITINNYPPQYSNGSATPVGSDQVDLTGNSWFYFDLPEPVAMVPGAYLEFEFYSTVEGELNGVGFDNNGQFDGVDTDFDNFFMIYGREVRTDLNIDYNNYSTPGFWISYTIPIGDILSGTFSQIVLMNDNDKGVVGNSSYRNMRLISGNLLPCDFPDGDSDTEDGIVLNCICQEVNDDPCAFVNFNQEFIIPYSITGSGNQIQDNGTGTPIECGAGLILVQNAWKAINIDYTVTPSTILEVQFKSEALGEIHGIGLDDNEEFNSSNELNKIYQFFGTQDVGNLDFYNYNLGDGWVSYVIPIGANPVYNGNTYNKMFFVGDDDDNPQDANSLFRGIRLYEEGGDDGCSADCQPPIVSECSAITLIANELGKASLSPSDLPNIVGTQTDLVVSYSFLSQLYTDTELLNIEFELGTNHILTSVSNACGSMTCECLTVNVECTDGDSDGDGICDQYDVCPDDATNTCCNLSTAADAVYDVDWSSGDNDADGFDPWILNSTGNAGHFVFTSTENGDGDFDGDGDIDSANEAWGLFANNSGISSAIRPFSLALNPSDQISLLMDNGFVGFGGSAGFSLLNDSGEELFVFEFVGGNNFYTYQDASGTQSTALGFSDEGLSIQINIGAEGSYSASITTLIDGNEESITGSFTAAAGGTDPAQVKVYNENSGDGSDANAYFNNLQICRNQNTQPDAVCQNVEVSANANCQGEVAASDVNNGSSDPDGDELSFSLSPEGPYSLGETNVILTVTDGNGASSTCTAVITVEDNTPPSLICPDDITIQADDNCSAVMPNVTGTSANSSLDFSGTQGQGNWFFGKYAAFDADNFEELPNFTGFVWNNPGTNLDYPQLDANGGHPQFEGLTWAVRRWVSDFYGTVNISGDFFDRNINCGDGANVRIFLNGSQVYEYLNIPGNSITYSIDLDVKPGDQVDFAIDPKFDAGCDDTHFVASISSNVVSDNCGTVSLSQSPAAGESLSLGTQSVVITATDNNGNVSNCAAEVTVEDNVDPVATAQNVTVQLDASGNGSTTAAAVDNGSDDACGLASVVLSQTDFDCSHVGDNAVTLTVTDVNGNSSTATATVMVVDGVAPVATAQNVTVQLDASGNGSTTAQAVNNGSSDACGVASLALSQTAFDCGHVGANTVTLTVTDVNGNSSTAAATVTVVDNVDPVALCKSATVQLDASGNGSITAADVNDGSNDACGIASLSVSPSSFDCSNVGANTVILTVTDNNGNVSTCAAEVTVEDNVAPTALCKPATVQLDASGNASITAADVNDGSNDACGIASLSVSPSSFDCSNVGANTVILTVTDNNGNVSTCAAEVTVEDNVDPVALCKSATVQLDASGNGSITAADVNDGSNDACGIASLSVSPSSFDCSNVGANTVILTVTDNNGNVSTCAAEVTVEDNVGPEALCKPATVQLDANGNASITAADVNDGSNDACGIASLSVSPSSFDCSNVGANTVTLTVTDNNGNVSTCAAEVTVEDNVGPEALCKPATVQLDANGNASITAADVNDGSNDACGIASLSVSPSSFDCSNLGANTVTLTVTDVNNNVSTCTAIVTVEDNVGPEALCKPATVQLDASGNASITAADVNDGSNDACGIASLSVSPSSFDCSNVGANTVTLTVTDNNGNVSICAAEVTVEDNVAPEAIAQDVTVQLDALGNGSTTAAAVDNGSSDACGIADLSLSQTDFDCSHVGDNAVTLTVTDNNGNVSVATATVTVEDNVAPTALCKPATVQLDASGNASITAADVNDGSNDACGIASLSVSPSSFDCSNVGANTVTLTVTDNNGNVSTCAAEVTVEDNVGPEAIAQDVTVQLDALGNGSTTATAVDNGSNDACGIALLALSQTAFDCSHVGDNAVTLTVTDNNGNVSVATATVTVEDNVAPTALCKPATVQLDASGNASITAADVNDGSNDACGIASLSVSPSSFDCSNVGANTVTLTVTDVNNNVSTCTAIVTVEDNVGPEALCKPATVQLDASGNASITAADVNDGSNDACGIASLSVSPSSFDCSNVGANTVTLTVTDNNGNVSICAAEVTVEDNVAPEAIAQDVTVQLDALGNGSTTAAAVDNGSSDACGIADLSLSQTDFDCSHVGANTVTLTVTDVNGNSSTAIATVMVVDGIAPTIECPTIDASYLTDASECSRTLSLEATTSDNCSSTLSYAVDGAIISFPYPFPLGSTEVTATATDGSGNSDDCLYIINVIDEPTVSISSPQDGIDGTVDDVVTIYNGSENVLEALGVTDFADLNSALDADCPGAVSYQWQVQNLQDDTLPSGNEADWVDIDMTVDLNVSASDDADFHHAYRLVITNSIGETSTSNYIRVYSIDTRCKGPNKVKVCMVPNGNPNNAHEICVNINAVDAILENSPGSFIGPCDPDFKLITDQAPDIEVYPNPTRSQLKINYRPYLNERTRIELYSSTGQLVKLVFDGLTEANLYHNEIVEMTNYENGIYLLRIIDSQGVHTERVILTK